MSKDYHTIHVHKKNLGGFGYKLSISISSEVDEDVNEVFDEEHVDNDDYEIENEEEYLKFFKNYMIFENFGLESML